MTESKLESESNLLWEELLRKMLPPGAPLPDEEHLDYSISVDYPDPRFPLPKPPEVIDLLSTRSSSDSAIFPKLSRQITGAFRDGIIKDPHSPADDLSIAGSKRKTTSSPLAPISPLDEFVSDHHDDDDFPKGGVNDKLYCSVSAPEVDSEEKGADLAVKFDVEDVSGEFSPSTATSRLSGADVVVSSASVGSVRSRKRGACSWCGKKNRLKKGRESCIVCGAKYCGNCVLKAMGSMPEGRKCVGCIGRPIDESRRSKLGRRSRFLTKVCSPLEVKQIMRAEKECLANQLRPEQLVVNGRQLWPDELPEVFGCAFPPQKLKPGRYWYDKDSGLWGKEGEKPDRIISSKLNIGGKLRLDASNGNTKVYMNGREITKVELRVLKLAKVQCPRDTHFWVYDDGSYEEEGQNNIKGNIWGKTGLSVAEYLEQGRVQKLLLFGLEGSGTSTIFKQVNFLYGNKFTSGERQNIKLIIQSNIYRYLGVLLEERERLEEDALMGKNDIGLDAEETVPAEMVSDGSRQCIYSINPRFKHFSDWLLDIMAMGDMDMYFPAATREYAPVVDEIWKDPAILETYKRREELHSLPDVAKYFLDHAIELSRNEYEPSEKDILYAEGVTPSNGLACAEFSFEDHSPMSGIYVENLETQPQLTRYQLIRISSKGLHDSFKWLDMLEDTRAVVFCVALSDYDEVSSQGTSLQQNKMLESRDLFESMVRHPCFVDTPFVLLLNKYDTFEEKINQVPLSVCKWLSDFSPVKPHHSSQSLAHQAYYYVAVKFKELYASINGKKLFVWHTRARERTSVDEAFKYIREVVKWDEEKDENMYGITWDDSFNSTELNSSPYIRHE